LDFKPLLKRLGEYSNQHPLQEALKEFGRVIKSIFMLKYFDDGGILRFRRPSFVIFRQYSEYIT